MGDWKSMGRARFWLTDGDFSGLGPSGGWFLGGVIARAPHGCGRSPDRATATTDGLRSVGMSPDSGKLGLMATKRGHGTHDFDLAQQRLTWFPKSRAGRSRHVRAYQKGRPDFQPKNWPPAGWGSVEPPPSLLIGNWGIEFRRMARVTLSKSCKDLEGGVLSRRAYVG